MTKIRKLKRKKKFRVNVNRKRLRNKQRRLPVIQCDEIQKAWEVSKSTRTNLKEMGLAYDVNDILQIPNTKQEMLKDAKRKVTLNNSLSDNEDEIMDVAPIKSYVAETLEAAVKMPRQRLFKLPKGQARFLAYLINKYGEDYKEMSRDKKNYDQLTPKQIRAKIKTFQSIPEQYNEYLQSNNT